MYKNDDWTTTTQNLGLIKNVSRILDRLNRGNAIMSPGKDLHRESFDNTGTPPMMLVQYRGNESLIVVNRCET